MSDPTLRLAHVEGRLAYEIDIVAALQALAEGTALLVDTRKQRSWLQGHATGALHLPSDRLDGDLVELPRDRTLVAYGWRPGGHGATHTARVLLRRGFDVRERIGGFEYWARHGFPVENQNGDATRPADPLVTADV